MGGLSKSVCGSSSRVQGSLYTQSFSMKCWEVATLSFFVGAGPYVWLEVGYLCWDGCGSIQEVEGGAPDQGSSPFRF